MKKNSIGTWLAAAAAMATAGAVHAQPQQQPATAGAASVAPSAELEQRAGDLVRMINGEATPEQLFTPAVLAQMPAERFTRIAEQMRSRRGRAVGVNRIEATDPRTGVVYIDFERSQLPLRIRVQEAPPHLIAGLAAGEQQ
jgi:hypothetical protein